MQVVFINECKSCEISNHFFFNVIKSKLFSGAISYGASNQPEVYLEPSQTSMREHFCKKICKRAPS